MPKKRYQVFVSSTYADLKDERQEVMHVLLQLGCFPSAMEIFPSADKEQMEFIKKIIDDCDYYILIVGGRYGSLTSEGISYTESEYDYAKEIGVPVLAFVHGAPDEIPVGKTDKDNEKREKLDAFLQKVNVGAIVNRWFKKDDLATRVATSMATAREEHPRPGWVRVSQDSKKKDNAPVEDPQISAPDLQQSNINLWEKREAAYQPLYEFMGIFKMLANNGYTGKASHLRIKVEKFQQVTAALRVAPILFDLDEKRKKDCKSMLGVFESSNRAIVDPADPTYYSFQYTVEIARYWAVAFENIVAALMFQMQ